MEEKQTRDIMKEVMKVFADNKCDDAIYIIGMLEICKFSVANVACKEGIKKVMAKK